MSKQVGIGKWAAASHGQGRRVAGSQGRRAAGSQGRGAADLVDGAGDSLGEAEQRGPVLVGRAPHAEGGEVRVAPAVTLHAHGAHGQQGGRDGGALPAGARGGELRGDGVVRRRHVPTRPRREARQARHASPCMRFAEALGGGTVGRGATAGPEL